MGEEKAEKRKVAERQPADLLGPKETDMMMISFAKDLTVRRLKRRIKGDLNGANLNNQTVILITGGRKRRREVLREEGLNQRKHFLEEQLLKEREKSRDKILMSQIMMRNPRKRRPRQLLMLKGATLCPQQHQAGGQEGSRSITP